MNIKDQVIEHLSGDVFTKTPLCNLYEFYGSDKSTHHNYSALYKKLFDQFANRSINFLEVGLGTNNLDVKSNMTAQGKPGASLFAISDLYPLWNIYGLDVDQRILFQEPARKISTYYVDQTDSSTVVSVVNNNFKDKVFHIILDDGLHEFAANQIFFENSFHLLAPGGFYIIEDILDADEFRPYFDATGLEYALVTLPHSYNKSDNTLLIIRK
jgi:SAM-dependent methyltransferase